MINIAAHPSKSHNNPYIGLFYNALEPYGVKLIHGLRVQDDYIRAHHRRLSVIHFQWCVEEWWRHFGPGFFKELRAVIAFWRFLRLARKLGIKIVWTLHDFEHHDGSRLVDRIGYRLLAAESDVILCHASWVPPRIARWWGVGSDKVMYLPIGNYDGAYPEPRSRAVVLESLGLNPDLPTLLCFGSIRPYKGFDVAVNALRLLKDGYQLIIAGHPHSPEYANELEDAVGDSPHIKIMLRHMTDQEIGDLIHASNCVIVPYRRITGSSAMLAALTFGRGVVASQLPFFEEALQREPEAGVLAPPDDPVALAEAVRCFFSVPVETRNRAARRLADFYSWNEIIKPFAQWLHNSFPQTDRKIQAGVEPKS